MYNCIATDNYFKYVKCTGTRINIVTSHLIVLNAEDTTAVLRVPNPVIPQQNVPCVEGHIRRISKGVNNIITS